MKEFISRNKYILLICIIVVASIMRLFALASNPPSLTWDEVAWGYNAYTLGVDLNDEFGIFMPLAYLESFGDFKPPLYAYLAVIPIKLFGLNEFAVRFPSAIAGIITVALAYLLAKRIFYNSPDREVYGLLTSSILAISPWHILLSRAAFEANVATMLIVAGVLFFLMAIQERRNFLVASSVCFALSLYTFNTARIVSPLIVLLLAAVFYKKIYVIKKTTIVACLVGFLLVLPTIGFLFSPQASLRFREVNIFSDLSVIEKSNKDIANEDNSIIAKIIHNRRILYFNSYLKHYLDHFNPQFLFISGDGNPKFSIQDVGQMYLWELPFLIFGGLYLFRKREGYWWIIPVWLMIGILPAATARETPHALRIETTLPTLQLLVAYGLVSVGSRIKKYAKLFFILLGIFVIGNFSYFIHNYFVHYPIIYSREWQYGYKDIIQYVLSQDNKYQMVNVSNSVGRGYVYFLFYTKTDPSFFRDTAHITRDQFGFVHVSGFGKYTFSDNPDTIPTEGKKALYINSIERIPANARILKTFYLLSGVPIFAAYELP